MQLAPTGAPRRRWASCCMHALRQGPGPHGAGAPGACMTSLRTHRPGARPRSAAERGSAAMRAHRVMHRRRGRPRAAAAASRSRRTGASAVGADRGPIPPSCVTTATPSPRQRVRVRDTARGMPNSVPGLSDRWDCNEKSVMTAYIVRLFRWIPRPAPRRLPPPRSILVRAPARAPRGAPAAVGSRPRRDRYRLGRPRRTPGAAPRDRPDAVAVPRVLPGFSGFSQVSPPLYLQVCECRHSN